KRTGCGLPGGHGMIGAMLEALAKVIVGVGGMLSQPQAAPVATLGAPVMTTPDQATASSAVPVPLVPDLPYVAEPATPTVAMPTASLGAPECSPWSCNHP